MREDMARVIVERPRIKAFKVRKGRRADFDDMPYREGMKRGHAWRGDTKELNENLQPLRRYLAGQVGNPQQWKEYRRDHPDRHYAVAKRTLSKHELRRHGLRNHLA